MTASSFQANDEAGARATYRPRVGDYVVFDHASKCEAFAEAIGVTYERPSSIWRWNDAPERTHADVMAAFDRALSQVPA